MKTLRLLLGDQLNHHHSWFQNVDPNITYVFIEARSETDYVRHHVQKIAAFFAAMRAFARHLEESGHRVIYIPLNDAENKGSIVSNLIHLCRDFDLIAYQLPDEWRLDQELQMLSQMTGLPVQVSDSEHFLSSRADLANFFRGKKTYLMENFYRHMRVKHHILMQSDGKPEGGQWNFDHDNRQTWKGQVAIPPLPDVSTDVSDIVLMIRELGVASLGTIAADRLMWPITRQQALKLLEHFLQYLLPHFGSYQDAMHTADPFLFHSRLSFAMNVKLLLPLEVVKAVESAWRARPDEISLSQAEGFIRQVIGWREYMRGVYWARMPDYAELNYFGHDKALPAWFWTADTKMNCLQNAIKGSLENAYAHHIQRLMVTGNFTLLAGIHPDEVDEWYLGIYIDALEWVEITNTRGMSQFADGGIVGTKPYVSSANYIDKMGNYCGTCAYDKKAKLGEHACPFNSLYWHFYHRNRSLLEKNPRIGMMYRTWDKMDAQQKTAILEQAEKNLTRIEQL
jgi:deoxyribodipyrimidine photolyase-related protein